MDIAPLADAVAHLSAKTPIGSVLKSAEWAGVPLALRQRAQFSSTITSLRLLQSVQDRLTAQAKQLREQVGEDKTATFDRSSFIDSIRTIARDEGLAPADPEKRGTIEDITSIPRLGMIYDMQNAQASGYAQWKLDQNEGALALYPAQRLTPSTARVPRATWRARWAEAGAAVDWEGAIKGDFVALKTSPIWAALSRFGTPWPPFDFGSTRELDDVDQEEAVDLGLLKKDEVPQPSEENFNANLQASVTGLSPEYRNILSTHFGDQVIIDGDTAQWQTDTGVSDYERQREEQQIIAGNLSARLGPALGANRSSLWESALAPEGVRQVESKWSAEIAAVAAGRKPLFHEDLGEPHTAQAIARAIAPALPPRVHVHAQDGHLYVWHSDTVAPFLAPGASELDQVIAHSDDGRWLGYGVNYLGPGSGPNLLVAIHKRGSNKPISGFRAPADRAKLFARARAQDFIDATGEPHDYAIRP